MAAVLALAAMTACEAGGEEPAPESPANAPTVAAGAPAGADETFPETGDRDSDAEIEAAARDLLAAEVGAGDFNLQSAQLVQWSDASLGCPEEGYAYAQVITPGRKLVFELEGATYPVHSNADGSHMVICGKDV